MTADKILQWLGLDQGTATKRAIRSAWHETQEGSDPTPRFLRIGCVPESQEDWPVCTTGATGRRLTP